MLVRGFERRNDMSAAPLLGIVLIVGFVGVALVASVAWREPCFQL
jgi:hypothetical protein